MMSYEPTVWKSGDIVTSAKLNKLEQGVAAGGSGGGFLNVFVNMETGALDKTWKEIQDAIFEGVYPMLMVGGSTQYTGVFPISCTTNTGRNSFEVYMQVLDDESYTFETMKAVATSENGYPVLQNNS